MKLKIGLLFIFSSAYGLLAQQRGDIRLGAAYDAYNFRGLGPSMRYYLADETAIQMEWMFNIFSDAINVHANMIKYRTSSLHSKISNQYAGIGVNIVHSNPFIDFAYRPNGNWVTTAPYLSGAYGVDFNIQKRDWVLNLEWRPKVLLFSPSLVSRGWPTLSLNEISVGMRIHFPDGSLMQKIAQ